MKCKNKKCRREITENSIYCNWCGTKQIKEASEIKVPEPRLLPSGKYFIQLRINGESVSITEDTESACVAKAQAIKTGLIEVKRMPKNITLGKAIDDYIEQQSNILSPSTIKSYKSYRKNHFASIMDMGLRSITPNILQKAINEETASKINPSGAKYRVKRDCTVSPKTIKNAYALISAVLSLHGCDWLSEISIPKASPTIGKTLTPDEVGLLIRSVKGTNLELPVLLSVWLSLRRSEIAGLEKSDFDFINKTVTVQRALVQNDKNEWIIKGTKTASSTRVISCPDYILDIVEPLPDGRIVHMKPNYMCTALQKQCDKIGLPKIRFHDLRHTNASIMLLLNLPGKYSMERGGWSSEKTMTGIYQHTIDTEKQKYDHLINNYIYGLIANEYANGEK